MNDPIPAGHVTLKSAFERYLSAFDGRDQDGRGFAFLSAFVNGDLRALTTHPANQRRDEIPASLWTTGAFPDRVFYADDIEPSEEWRAYSRRTPYVAVDELSLWVKAQVAAQTAFLRRLQGEYWTIDEALNWILWRDENPNGIDIIVRLLVAKSPGEPRPVTNFDSAKGQLLRSLRRGEVKAVATNPDTRVVEPVPAGQFTTAEFQHSELGHLAKFPAHERDTGLNGGHLNMLRIHAGDVVQVFPVGRSDRSDSHQGVHLERSRVEFDPDERSMQIFRASQWLALEGKSGSVSLEEVEHAAQTRLFPALAAATLAADAIETATMQPCKVPASRWAILTTDEAQPGQLLQWINVWWFTRGPGTGDQIGGELIVHESRVATATPVPTWVQVSLQRDDLMLLLNAKQAPRRRGAQPGQGMIDDSEAIRRVYELERSGIRRRKATEVIGAEIGKGDEKLALRTTARLWRKTKGGPAG